MRGPSEFTTGTTSWIPGQPRPRRWLRMAVIVGVVITLGTLVFLALVPVPQSASFSLGVCPAGGSSIDLPNGVSADVTWSEPDGTVVGFSLTYNSGNIIYETSGSHGGVTFTVDELGPVGLYAYQTTACPGNPVAVSVHWTSPILWQLSRSD